MDSIKISYVCKSGFDPWVGKIPWRRERLPTPVFCIVHGVTKSWARLERLKKKKSKILEKSPGQIKPFQVLAAAVIVPSMRTSSSSEKNPSG